MLLGLHNYSLYQHGLGGRWMGFTPPWPTQLNIFDFLDLVSSWGLDGVHLDMAAIDSCDPEHIEQVKSVVQSKQLYIEFNWGLPKPHADQRLQFDLQKGVEIAHQLGADLGKVSLNLTRPRPVMASRHDSGVKTQLITLCDKIKDVIPSLERFNIKLALENHTDCYTSEILWVLKYISHPLVGACIDTVNPIMVGEDPMQAIEELAPYSFTNHFRDSIIEQTPYGCRIVGCALGDGDLDLKKAYKLIENSPEMNRINIEIALEPLSDDMNQVLNAEKYAVEKSIIFCQKLLKTKSI